MFNSYRGTVGDQRRGEDQQCNNRDPKKDQKDDEHIASEAVSAESRRNPADILRNARFKKYLEKLWSKAEKVRLISLVKRGELEALKISLLAEDVNVEIRDEDGLTLLHYAAKNNHREMVKILIEHGCDIDSPNNQGDTPLLMTVKAGNQKIAETLLAKGADCKKKDINGHDVLDIAILSINPDLVEILLKSKKLNNEDLNRALEMSLQTSCDELSSDQKKDLEKVIILLVNQNAIVDNMPLNPCLYKSLSEEAIYLLCGEGDLSVAFLAMQQKLPELLEKALLEDRCLDINFQDLSGNTILHYFMKNANQPLSNEEKEIFKLLSQHGANINLSNKYGETPLSIARSHRLDEFLQIIGCTQEPPVTTTPVGGESASSFSAKCV